MFNEVSSRKDTFIITILKSLQMILFGLIFVVCVFWILQIANFKINSDWQDIINSLLAVGDCVYGENIKIFSYYLDFSYLSTILIFGLSISVLNFCIDTLKNQEQKAEIRNNKKKKEDEVKLNKELQSQFIAEELKYKNCILLINFEGKHVKTNWDDVESPTTTSKELADRFEKYLDETSFPIKKFVYEDLLCVKIDNISQIDIKLNALISILNKFETALKQESCFIKWNIAIDTYKQETECNAKMLKLKCALKNTIKDSIICFSSFKFRYELNPNKKYALTSQGIYNVYNEDIEVFTLNKI